MSSGVSRLMKQPMERKDTDYVAGGRPLTGWRVLAIFVGLFAIVLAANGVMAYFAVKTFRGEVVAHPYERGVAYNRDIAQAREQAARNWAVDVQLSRGAGGETDVAVSMRDADGADVSGVVVDALFAAPADLTKDIRLHLEESAPGRYAGKAQLPAGQRALVLTAAREGKEVFRSTNRVEVR